jgi:hypothetical protein
MQSAYDLAKTKWPNQKYLVNPWLPIGFHAVLAGPTNTGKSIFRMNLALCVAAGKTFLGYATHSANTLICQWENTERQESERLKTMFPGKLEKIPRNLHFLDSKLQIGNEGARDKARQVMAVAIESQDIQFVIYDCLSNLGLEDENSSSKVRPALDFLSDLDRDFGLSSLLIHHWGKCLGDQGLFTAGTVQYRGSSTIGDWAQYGLNLQEKDGKLELSFPKTKEIKQIAPVNLILQDSLWFRKATDEEGISGSHPDNAITALGFLGGMASSHVVFRERIMTYAHCTSHQADEAIKAAIKMGIVQRVDNGSRKVYKFKEEITLPPPF